MRRIGSFFLTIFVCCIIFVCMAISLDLVGVVKLPENFSLKKYLSKSIGTMGAGEEIYYPDYEATGLNAENEATQTVSKIDMIEKENDEDVQVDIDKINEVIGNTNQEDSSEVVTSEYNVTDNSFFYTQLNTYGKTFYSRLYSNLDNLKTGTYSIDFGVNRCFSIVY